MRIFNQNYVNGTFIDILGDEVLFLKNPTTEEVITEVRMSTETDALKAIESAKNAMEHFSQTTVQQRKSYLKSLHDALTEKMDMLKEATVEEYGASEQRALWSNQYAADIFLYFQNVLDEFEFEKTVGNSRVVMEPVGVTVILTAWNSSAGSICVKLAAAIAAGCTVIIKPSEFSAQQTQILMECFHKANLPSGVINVINGRGAILGELLSTHPYISKICFTGSTQVGQIIARNASNSMKRLTLELSGKSPNIILEDADLETAIPMAVQCCFQNNGQACIAGSRLLVPEKLLPEVKKIVVKSIEALKVGDPRNPKNDIGPLANEKQFIRVQNYIRFGIEEGAELLIGGEGKPKGNTKGYFVKPTAFANVTSDMVIAKEEIFGPVLSILTYRTEEEAISIANDTVFGLHAFISSNDIDKANLMAKRIQAGRVSINTMAHDPYAPFGGFKMSGIGREGGIYGLEAQLEPKAILI
ncbi:aldehyde dehydrogenase family protein [Mariniflexile gromovii]|uniref:aldehyde dehydrogenase (NAD(+)) n=1 Tax=Mariniflexile gromovii TaxID=362523 RepID=A0ABS4BP85_9FLAO|nr:aldehyde dehydrogenase family protein [Mariniflexile gromovii]MBP0902218.1 aldehyde dehydrogenase family protein [Mariniflexile gromovii]